MFKSVRGRLITVLVIALGAMWQLYGNYRDTGSPIKLGLDLQGGMHLVLEVDDSLGTLTPEARAAGIDQAEQVLRTRIDEFGVEEPLIQKSGSERIIVELAGISDTDRARDIIQQAAFLEFKLVDIDGMSQAGLARIDRALVSSLGVDSIRALGRDIEAPTGDLLEEMFGSDSTDAAADSASADAAQDSAAATDEAEQETAEPELNLRPFSSLLRAGDSPGTYLVDEEDVPTARLFLSTPAAQAALPRNISLQWGNEPLGLAARTYRRLYVLVEEAFMSGEYLEDAQAQRDPQFNQAIVNFQFNRAGGRLFSRFTGANVNEYLAIVLDGEVMSAPIIRDRIGASGQIEMAGAPLEEARDLALVLRAGALTTPLRIMEERTVGPSLGQDSIDQGEIAGIVGVILVLFIMIGYYRVAGMLSIVALTIYLILVMGGMAGIGATLTLPGIAGLILSVGMAVDANVLIFERIREELAAGRATRTAVDEGFGHALSAIVDANVTTLITALILFQFGTGPVRGFAVTLSIGIVASFFSAIYVTRTFFLLYLQGKKASDPISI
ncbi:MAG: protein translocase subunit SecD [Gemmatimonadetes bacterium]|nr:protein translocase subunit SecD [Gemmatimonadota bacterium]MBT8404327.1 protein translocase subunit SecD [Gemmatimonadota bacterium]NNK63904.1 protein translocase subunit SecD [Gemmatimonadota bacterium]